MSNKAKLILLLVFAALTFYQFYSYARTINLSNLYPPDSSVPVGLYGVYGGQDVATATTNANAPFDPLIVLLALNIALWVERPDRVRRAPLILAFIANLSIVIMRVGIAAPALKLATATPQNDIQSIWNLASLHAKWNAVYLLAATLSGLVVLGLLIQLYVSKNTISSARVLFSKVSEEIDQRISLPDNVQHALLFIFALLAFYQFYLFASVLDTHALIQPDTHESITTPSISLPSLPPGTFTLDAAISYPAPDFSFGSLYLLLALSTVLWIKRPNRIGQRLLISAFITNLTILVIHLMITSPVLNLTPTTRDYMNNIWIIRNFYAKWDFVYLMPATVSSLIGLAMLVQVYDRDQVVMTAIRLHSQTVWQFWKSTPISTTIEYALLLVFGLLVFYQFFRLASTYPFDLLFAQHNPVLIGTFVAPISTAQFDPSLILIVLNIILLLKPLNPFWRVPLVVILVISLTVILIQKSIIAPTIQYELATGRLTTEMFNSTLRWNFVRLLASLISALVMVKLLVQILRKR
ncbi:MAG: hypothetical protein H0X30_37400 [Anaerolineae bacterium]|nr:hypothetical protein [Anaerolineae bacterium]